jgi:hypothetical protein
MLRRTYLLALWVLLLTSCSGSLTGPPEFRQAYGTVDEPCAASKAAVAHCTAHVYLVNGGGEGIGHATVAVTLKDEGSAASSARTNLSVKCGTSIPDTAAGAEVDLTCPFDLSNGTAVAAPPILQAVDFTAAAGSVSSSGNAGGLVAIGLAVVAVLLAAWTLGVVVTGRRRTTSRATQRPAPLREQTDGDDGSW